MRAWRCATPTACVLICVSEYRGEGGVADPAAGIIPRVVEGIFSAIAGAAGDVVALVRVSFLEIYRCVSAGVALAWV